MNTRSDAAMIPGFVSGRKTRKKVWALLAPRLREALVTRGSMPCMLASSGRMA